MKRSAKLKRLGPFEIVKDLAAKGAQGKLYVGRALEPCFDGLAEGALVALKVMEVHDDDGERAFRRLERRTEALVAAANPGVVRYYGCFDASDESSDRHVVVMELLRGQTLEERLEQNRLGLDSDYVLRVITTCAEALVRVAEFGLVHRDIKPSNIFLCDDGGVKLIDFEIARQEGASRTTTESGAMRGTVDYMAPDFHPDFRPEKGFRGDECSDVFSLTVCLYEMLAGTRPYAVGGMMGEQSMMAYFQRWTKVAGTDVTKSLKIEGYKIHALAHVQKVIKKGLSPDRAGRYQTYREFRDALRTVKVRELASPGGARYDLLRCVGKGGFGVVFRARRQFDGLVVAIKCLLRAEYSERFAREARALAKFSDDRLVSFVEYFAITRAADETHFIVMQFLDGMPGSSLRDRIAAMGDRERGGERLPFREIVIAFRRYAGGLKVLHGGGIIHRDIKPANLYMPPGAPERACVMDLGVVKTEETQTNGSLPGTLDYMPPEMALGQSRGSPAVDIYALGLCLYEALTGQPMFPRLKRGGDGLAEFYRRAREAAPPDLSRLDELPSWQNLVRDMTAHDATHRISDCAVVERRLNAIPASEIPEPVAKAGPVDDDDDTFETPPHKPIKVLGKEVGIGQSSKSVPAIRVSEEDIEDSRQQEQNRTDRQPEPEKQPEKQPEKPSGDERPARTESPESPKGRHDSAKAEPPEDETKTAALAGDTAAVAAADVSQTIATRAAAETRPTAKLRKKASKPLIRVTIPLAQELAHPTTGRGAAAKPTEAPRPATSQETPKPARQEPTKQDTPKPTKQELPKEDTPKLAKQDSPKQDTARPAKPRRETSEKPAPIVVTRRNGLSPSTVRLALIAIAVVIGAAVIIAKIAKTKDITIDEYGRIEAIKQLDGERAYLKAMQLRSDATDDIDAMRELLAKLEKHTVPSYPKYDDIDKDLAIIRGGINTVKMNLAKKIKDVVPVSPDDKAAQEAEAEAKAKAERRKKAEETLGNERKALAAANDEAEAATTLDAMNALTNNLAKWTQPAMTEIPDIDQELAGIANEREALANKLSGKIDNEKKIIENEERERRNKAEEVLAKERSELASISNEVAKAMSLDEIAAMHTLTNKLAQCEQPANTGFGDIDDELAGIAKDRANLVSQLKNAISAKEQASLQAEIHDREIRERERRNKAEENLAREQNALTTARKDVGAAQSLERMNALKDDLGKWAKPATTGYDDIDQELGKIAKDRASLASELNTKIETEKRRIEAEKVLFDEQRALAAISDEVAKATAAADNAKGEAQTAQALAKLNALTNKLANWKEPKNTEFSNINQAIAQIITDRETLKETLNSAITGLIKEQDDYLKRRAKAAAEVAARRDALADAKSKLAKISSRSEYQALKTELEGNSRSQNILGFDDLDKENKTLSDEFGKLLQTLLAQRATLRVNNPLREPVEVTANGMRRTVQAGGTAEIELPVWTDSLPYSARVTGDAAGDYAADSGQLATRGPAIIERRVEPRYLGDPTLTISNGNGVEVVAAIDGQKITIPAGKTLERKMPPRSTATVAFSFSDSYELAGGSNRATVTMGNAGTSRTVVAPSLNLKPRKVFVENPTPGKVSWTAVVGSRAVQLGDYGAELTLDDGVTQVRLEALAPTYPSKPKGGILPEFAETTLDISDVRRGAATQRRTFTPAPLLENRRRNIAAVGARGMDTWYWLDKGTPVYDGTRETREAECDVIAKRLSNAIPNEPEKTEQVADWLNAAKLMALICDDRYRDVCDEAKLADWGRTFSLCRPADLNDKHGFRDELERYLATIRARLGGR